MKFILLLAVVISVAYAYPNLREGRQGNVTVAQNATPAIYPTGVEQTKPELVPTVVDTNPPIPTVTPAPVNVTTTTQAPDDEDDSSEEEDNEADSDDENADADADEDEETEADEEESRQIPVKESTLIPGYISPSGELLVPIDAVQSDVQYSIVEDPEESS